MIIGRIVWRGGARDGQWVGVRVGRLAVRWDNFLVSTAHPFIDECHVRLDDTDAYGGFMFRLWPRRTDRRTRGIAVMWRDAHPMTFAHRRAARARARTPRPVSPADGTSATPIRPR